MFSPNINSAQQSNQSSYATLVKCAFDSKEDDNQARIIYENFCSLKKQLNFNKFSGSKGSAEKNSSRSNSVILSQ